MAKYLQLKPYYLHRTFFPKNFGNSIILLHYYSWSEKAYQMEIFHDSGKLFKACIIFSIISVIFILLLQYMLNIFYYIFQY